METGTLKKFARAARRQLREQVAAKLELVLNTESAELRQKQKAINQLKEQIKKTSKESVIQRVAYTWFNRFCALGFMDVNRYTRTAAVTPAQGYTQPEILREAKQGHIHDNMASFIQQQTVFDILSGKIPSSDPQQEAFRLLLVGVCNYYNTLMPFMFEKIEDYTELLLPEDLLSQSSILSHVRKALTPGVCQDVEVIGWLYQFYISEKKDEVIAGLKKNKKITPPNIPAATQLFTPHWIVRYLVENSLGRLWLLNRPNSRLKEKMEYYIEPEQTETDFIRISSLEELKICDPACGSGHMLVYAFEILYAIYEEEGYDAPDIPHLILENNLYGIEIDERAGELAAFALVMKAREKHRHFFRKPVQPNICVLENIKFESGELKSYIDEIGPNIFTLNLQTALLQFEEADNFGSLIRPALSNVPDIYRILEERNMGGKIFLHDIHKRVLKVLKQADFLSPKYHVVIANPPYMGGKGMNERLKVFAQENYPESKSDLFSMFIERIMELVPHAGFMGFMTPFTWMFLSSYEKLRSRLLNEYTILSLVKPSYTAFFKSAIVPICTFIIYKYHYDRFSGSFFDLGYLGNAEEQPERFIQALSTPSSERLFKASSADFKKIPGWPIAYWVSDRVRNIFVNAMTLKDIASPKIGMRTGDNDRFLRFWYETSNNNRFCPSTHRIEDKSSFKWIPYNKGGNYRKWYGNFDFVVNWENDGFEIKETTLQNYPQLSWDSLGWKISNENFYFREGVTWTDLSSSCFGVRYLPPGYIFDAAGPCLFGDNPIELLVFLVTKQCFEFLKILNPTLHFKNYNISSLPIIFPLGKNNLSEIGYKCIELCKLDWDSYETSWDFTELPLMQEELRKATLEETYQALRQHWREMTMDMKRLEEENNRIFINAYGLQDELTPDVPLEEITLTCNPYYRFEKNKNEKELESLLLADTMKEFISFAVGCMFGRYSLDKPGLVLANQGETLKDYLAKIPQPTFAPDDDNVIPLMEDEWFTDDIAGRFRNFLRVSFGEEYYPENLAFIENALGKNIRKYFIKDFYNDHIKRYKKRPVYWLFSSPNASFNALIYMHRYRPDTVSLVLNDYLRNFRTKLNTRKSHLEHITISASSSQNEKTAALKEMEKIRKIITELETWEREVLYPLASRQIEIDLDDGVKVNYPKLGRALKKIPGLG